MALRAPHTLPLEGDPTVRTNLWEHFGVHATLHPHHAPTAVACYMQPRMEPLMWFHDMPQLATIHAAKVAADATPPQREMPWLWHMNTGWANTAPGWPCEWERRVMASP